VVPPLKVSKVLQQLIGDREHRNHSHTQHAYCEEDQVVFFFGEVRVAILKVEGHLENAPIRLPIAVGNYKVPHLIFLLDEMFAKLVRPPEIVVGLLVEVQGFCKGG